MNATLVVEAQTVTKDVLIKIKMFGEKTMNATMLNKKFILITAVAVSLTAINFANAANLDLGGTYDLDNGGSVGFDDINLGISAGGSGTVNHTDGHITVTDDIFVGKDGSQTGAYNLSGNTSSLDVTDIIYVGYNGTGTFTQAGCVNSNYRIYLGSNSLGKGSYNLSGSSSSIITDLIAVGYSGSGEFTQAGGDITVRNLNLGLYGGAKGTYNLTDSSASITTSYGVFVGQNGTGIFNHSAGSISGKVGTEDMHVGFNSSSKGTYNLSGSSAEIDLDILTVAYDGGDGVFNHTAGSSSLSLLTVISPPA